MRNLSTLAAALLLGIMMLAGTGCDKLKARDHINMGIAAFKNAKYNDAVEHFKQSMELDPTLQNAQLYLATAYMVQWIPGAESPENTAFADKSRKEFLSVLEKDPKNVTALASLASLAYNSALSLPLDQKLVKFKEADEWNHKLIEVDPQNKEALYSLGVIAYGKWHPALMTARVNLRMKPEDPGPLKDKKVKEELRAQYAAVVDEGIADLNKALEIDKEYEDAMAYINLLVREKADLLDDKDEYKKQIEIADGWLQKALDTKKAKQARSAKTPGGIVNDTQ